MTNNIININQNNELENKLKSDAEQLNNEVSPLLREQLIARLSTQTIKSQPLKHPTHSFFKNKMAIAASFIFAVFIIQFFVAQHSIEETVIASNNSNQNIDEILLSFSSKFKKQDLLASQDLNKEYNAILADLEKVKKRIITL